MPRYKIEFVCNWEPRKRGMAEVAIRKWLANMGGVSELDRLRMEEVGAPEQPALRMLRLTCAQPAGKGKAKSICGQTWQNPTFTPCPKCNGRAFVTKVAEADYEKHPLTDAPPEPAPGDPKAPPAEPPKPPTVEVVEPEKDLPKPVEVPPGTPETQLPPAVVSQRAQEEESYRAPNW